jgi:hypothetical protein
MSAPLPAEFGVSANLDASAGADMDSVNRASTLPAVWETFDSQTAGIGGQEVMVTSKSGTAGGDPAFDIEAGPQKDTSATQGLTSRTGSSESISSKSGSPGSRGSGGLPVNNESAEVSSASGTGTGTGRDGGIRAAQNLKPANRNHGNPFAEEP